MVAEPEVLRVKLYVLKLRVVPYPKGNSRVLSEWKFESKLKKNDNDIMSK